MIWNDGPLACTLSRNGILLGQIIRNNAGGWEVHDIHLGAEDRILGSPFEAQAQAKVALEIAQRIDSAVLSPDCDSGLQDGKPSQA